MPTQVQMRNGTAAQWTAANPVLYAGEIGVESDTGYMKVGDGTTAWNSKAYAMTGGRTTSQIIAADGRTVQQILDMLLAGTSTSPPVSKPVNTSVPVITGTVQVGQTLTATNGVWTNSPTGYDRQWYRFVNNVPTAINGAYSLTYVPVTADIGCQLSFATAAKNSAGTADSVVSVNTAAVTAAQTFTEYATDSFARADSNPIGLPWVQMVQEAQMQLYLNRMSSSLNNAGGVYNLRQTSEVYRDNQYCEFTFADAVNGDAGPFVGARADSYHGYFVTCKSTGWHLTAIKSTFSDVLIIDHAQPNSGDTVSIRKVWINTNDHTQGMDIIVSLNNLDIGHYVDTTPVLGGSPAVYAYNNGVRFSSWAGGSSDKPWSPGTASNVRGTYGT